MTSPRGIHAPICPSHTGHTPNHAPRSHTPHTLRHTHPHTHHTPLTHPSHTHHTPLTHPSHTRVAGELPESVLGPCLQPVVDGPPSTGKECAALLTQLPQPQLAIVRWLLRLMLDISAHEPVNRMTPKSMAVVFAPNLVDPPPTMAPMDAFEVNRRVVTFVERLIEHEVTPAHLDEPTWRS